MTRSPGPPLLKQFTSRISKVAIYVGAFTGRITPLTMFQLYTLSLMKNGRTVINCELAMMWNFLWPSSKCYSMLSFRCSEAILVT